MCNTGKLARQFHELYKMLKPGKMLNTLKVRYFIRNPRELEREKEYVSRNVKCVTETQAK